MNSFQRRLKASFNEHAITLAVASNTSHLTEDQMNVIIPDTNARVTYKKKVVPKDCELSSRQYEEMLSLCNNL